MLPRLRPARARQPATLAPLAALALALATLGALGAGACTPTSPPAVAPKAVEVPATKLRPSTRRMIASLTLVADVRLYAVQGAPRVDAFVEELRGLLADFEREGRGKLKVATILGADRAKWPDALADEAAGAASASSTEAGDAVGLVITYGGQRLTLRRSNGLRFGDVDATRLLLARRLREMRDVEHDLVYRIGVLQGHEESGFQELAAVTKKYVPFYAVEAVDLAKGEREIDPTLEGLLVVQPRTALSTKELRRIDQFLMRGKPVAVFANGARLKDADVGMELRFARDGAVPLLAAYGVTPSSALLVDRAQSWLPQLVGRNGTAALACYPGVLAADPAVAAGTLDRLFPPLLGLDDLTIPLPTELVVDRARAGGEGVTVTPVIETTADLSFYSGDRFSVHPEHFGEGARGTRREKRKATVALVLAGAIKSAFPGGGEGIAAAGPSPACDAALPAVACARLFVVSSGGLLGNVFHDAGKSPFEGQIPGMDPNIGADETLLRYWTAYDARARASSLLLAKQTFDWMIDASW